MLRLFALLSIALLAVGCAHSSQLTWKIDDMAVMKTTLTERIPIGTSLSDAQRFMESESFHCSEVSQGAFMERSWWGDDKPLHEGLDYVLCERKKNEGFWANQTWQVALVHDGNVVTDILVSNYLSDYF